MTVRLCIVFDFHINAPTRLSCQPLLLEVNNFHFSCVVLGKEDGETIPGGQERAEGISAAAGLWLLAGQGFSE